MIPWRVTIAKSITWKVIGILTLVAVAAFFGVPGETIGLVTAVYHVATLVLYVAHERIWGAALRKLTKSQ